MKQIWAPWRMEYIEQVDDSNGCFLCAALAHPENERESLVLHRGETCLCILNRFPYNSGHVLVAPNAHKGSLDELSDAESLEIHRLVRDSVNVLEKTIRPHGFNIGVNLGRAAGAGLPEHVHWHVVPRWNGDTNFMPVLSNSKVLPQALSDTWEMLSRAFKEG